MLSSTLENGYAMRKGFWKGLKAIELIIMAVIVATILGVVYYRYDSFQCHSMQSEAKFSLQEIYAAQKLYHTQHDHYASLKKLHSEEGRVILPKKYYIVFDESAPQRDSFKILAKGASGSLVDGDIWSIDHNNNLVNEYDACVNK